MRASKAFLGAASAILVVCVCLVGARPTAAAEIPDWIEDTDLSLLVFGDIYAFASHHDPEVDGANGLWLRRIYLTLDHRFDEHWKVRLRFEANSSGDFVSGDQVEPFVKDAYLEWQGESELTVRLGLAGTPTWGAVESLWGYRALEKTVLDLQRLGSSRDSGVAVLGRLADGKVRYHAMVGTGSGTRTETNGDKKAMLAVGLHPNDRWIFELYGDRDSRPGERDRETYRLFGGWRGESTRVGLEAGRQSRQIGRGRELEIDVASLFGVHSLSERVRLVGRVDRVFDPNPDAERIAYLRMSPDAESTLLIAAVDIEVADGVRLMPNIEYVAYDAPAGAIDPDDDLVVRLTFVASF